MEDTNHGKPTTGSSGRSIEGKWFGSWRNRWRHPGGIGVYRVDTRDRQRAGRSGCADNRLSNALNGLELDRADIVENLGVPQAQVDAVVELMQLASSVANLSQLIAAQLGSATANEITQQVQRIGGLVDLVDTVDGFTEQLRDQIRADLDSIADALTS
jgi:hypothetical protein